MKLHRGTAALMLSIAASLIGFIILGPPLFVEAAGPNPVPFIGQPLRPDAVRPGGQAFALTVDGTGFVPGAVVRWNGGGRATSFVSSSRLTATILASDIVSAKTVRVTVFNPSPGGGESNGALLEVTPLGPSMALAKPIFFTVNGDTPTSIAVADFNRDGKSDMALANEGSDNVSILLGKGDGTFNAGVSCSVGAASQSVAVGDFDSDGNVDLAVADSGSGNVSILEGNGDGTFKTAVHYVTGLVPYSLATGDFNRDGKLDVAVTNNGSSNVSVLLGRGDGTFQAAWDYTSGLDPTGLGVGDLNGDGKLDLVVADNGVLFGAGDGSFKMPVKLGASGLSVTVGDLNADHIPDLAIAKNVGNDVSLILGAGGGIFRPPVQLAATSPTGVEIADFNGDGNLDLAVLEDYPNYRLRVLLRNADGTFGASAVQSTEAGSRSIAVADFNGDGRLDIAVGFFGRVGVLLQAPIVSFSVPEGRGRQAAGKTGLLFGIQPVGSTSTAQMVTLSNVSGLPLKIGSMAITGAAAMDFSTTSACASTLAPATTCNISVTFKPTAIGTRTASLAITDNAFGSPQSLGLVGTGVTTGSNATLSGAGLTFVPQLLGTASPAKTVVLANYGTLPLSITSISANGDFREENSCGSSLGPGVACPISVVFKPTQIGTRTGALTIKDNAPGNQQTVSLTGAGTIVKLVPASIGFGTVSQCKRLSMITTLTNSGSKPLSVSSITITGASVFSQTNNCSAVVGAGQSCAINVTFKTLRGFQPGTYTGAVMISDNGGGGFQTVPLSGTIRLCRSCCFF